uniref:Tail fiber protein n=1 Tax=Myoviridae sp. ctsK93 TaxID=2825190 RepID=A0A8S5PJV0_9CAUD|nr:MAG TPA: hypothetical protein [Myoviridae sp. ctsK93]
MAELKGTQVAAIVVPFTDADKYATHDAEYGKGGFRSVSTIADRDAIPVERKTEGMIVRVTANGLNYEWKNNAWAEWLPKGNIVIDTALNVTSTNPVQNKVITTRVQTIENSIALILEQVKNIPIITVDTAWNATSNNPASSKAIESAISPIRTTANSAKSIADAAIPKSYIDDTMPENLVATRVPSTKLLGTVSVVANTAKSTADSAMTTAKSAGSVANAAIPKSWIDSRIDGTETSNNSVPGTGAIVAYINNNNTGLSTQISNTNSRVTNLESWKNTIGTKGAANGVAGLDSTGKVPSSQLPSYVDDVIDVVSFVTSNPTSGMTIGNVYYNSATKKLFTATSATAGVTSDPEAGKIYVSIANNKTYRWSGSIMTEISASLALGTTSSTAFRGDYGNTLYTNFGSGTNLQGTKDARNFFYNMSLSNSLENISILKDLVVQPEANFVRLQNDIVYLIGEVNTGDGYDIPAATTTKAGVMTADMFNLLQELEKATFPLTLTLGGAGTFEVGSSTSVPVNITAVKGGQDVTPNATIKVIAGGNHPGNLSPNKKSWTPSSPITAETRISVAAQYEGRSKTAEIYYRFKYKKYWGTSSKSTLTNSDILALGGSTWADSRTMGATTFDCTGGKYVYYVIPSSLGTPEFWVGGLKNTDVVTTSATVTNASGGSTTYSIMRLANIQTGVLSVQFK